MNQQELTPLKAIYKARCPRCRKGKMFLNPMYGLKPQRMHTQCPHCGLRYEREPGYFYVAMYVSYAFVVAEMVTAGLLTYFITLETKSPWLYIAVTLATALMLAPFNYRYSRVVLLHWLTPGLKRSSNGSDKPKKP